ncbi:membrane protein YqaA with SNARE-associated domain [Lipingzhangella halophila]|uniref:Membrane protein YqaA with SNARE-associated domain n=1 Tax=Lipingzhangella halophila TaxID=1783352 RepID=A0A7W7RK70_9ACTN|nr:VTT domain-containing protein [Lipingzhangella halophila]MBB4933514.1 membrane protein YqaA with SNARE-associated domain [Lipingzhangella halophila]
MIETFSSLLFGLASALLPVLNVELYLVGAAAAMKGDGALFAMAVAAGFGQTVGKIGYYYMGRGALDIPWLRRKAEKPNRWSERVAGWRSKAEGRPWWTAGLVGVSSLTSIPPFMVICVLAGTVRMPFLVFTTVTFATRTVRFLLLVYAPSAAMALVPG